MKRLKFVICVKNEGFEASLELRKVYDLLQDTEAKHHGMLRVIDESGEDYLFPENFFVPIDLPAPVQARLADLV
jgi:hypothetical protein